MLDRILNQMRNRIRTRQYIMTVHAEEEMDDDDLSILDVESVVLPAPSLNAKRMPRQVSASTLFVARP